jgi:peptide deformylase
MVPDPVRLSILRFPAPALRQRALPLESVNDRVRAVAARMIELMRAEDGVGLAATQVGVPWRLFVANARGEGETDRVYVNPVLSSFSREMALREEGCLSLPGIRVDIRRPVAVTMTALDLDGRSFTLTSDDLLARIWQHEVDHLDGVLIIDRMSPMDRLATRKALKELQAAAGAD